MSDRKKEVKTMLDDITKKHIEKGDATLESLNDYSRKELSDLIDSIIFNISKIGKERDFFEDYFNNIETQTALKVDKEFIKNAPYKRSNLLIT
jgi:hypothetical protein